MGVPPTPHPPTPGIDVYRSSDPRMCAIHTPHEMSLCLPGCSSTLQLLPATSTYAHARACVTFSAQPILLQLCTYVCARYACMARAHTPHIYSLSPSSRFSCRNVSSFGLDAVRADLNPNVPHECDYMPSNVDWQLFNGFDWTRTTSEHWEVPIRLSARVVPPSAHVL